MRDNYTKPYASSKEVLSDFTMQRVCFGEVVTGEDLADAVRFILNEVNEMLLQYTSQQER